MTKYRWFLIGSHDFNQILIFLLDFTLSGTYLAMKLTDKGEYHGTR